MKIAIKTRHPSGENKEPTRVVESKRRSFIVSRVAEHTVIKDKITEDDMEDASQDQPSPESTQSSVKVVPSPSLLHSQHFQPSDSDTCTVSDSEKSLKAQGKDVPVNINDLEEQLTRLTRGGNVGNQLELATGLQSHPSENHSPIPSEDGSVQSQLIPPQQQVQPSQQLSVDKPVSTDSSPHDKPQSAPQSSQQQPSQQHPSMPAMMPQGQPVHQQSNQSLPTTVQQQQGMPGQQQPPQQAGQSQKPIQQQGSTEMQNNPNMPSGMYPHMSYFPVMQHPMYGFSHGSGGMMHQVYSDQMHPMQYLQMPNQMVPYVMINVQQQHQVAPMLVPANMIMPSQMPYMGGQAGSFPHQHSETHSEPVMASPPGTPPQSRKQHSIETQSDSGVITGDASSPAPMRGNYSIASLEQELIRKLHGGTRKDIPLASGAVLGESFSGVEGSGARLHEDRPQWTQSCESLTSVQSGPADLGGEGLKKLEELDNLEEDSAATVPRIEKVVPKKKLRFQVERVIDDPYKVSAEQSDIAQTTTSTDTQSVSVSGDKETKSEKDDKPVRPAKLGRFSVSKVVEKPKSIEDSETVKNDATEVLPSVDNKTENKESVIKGLSVGQSSNETSDSKDVQISYAVVPNTIQEESEDRDPTRESTEITSGPDKPLVSKLQLHDLPYRKKSMSFFEGTNSPMLSNNTCDSFYNSHMDRYQIFSRRRTKSLGSIQSRGSMQSISMQTQCTQYGDGETPSPSPSPRDTDREFPEIVFDLAPVGDEISSSDSDPESQDGAESGIDSGSRIISPRPPLRRQARKVREKTHGKTERSMWFPNQTF